jgi:hypothetical protein
MSAITVPSTGFCFGRRMIYHVPEMLTRRIGATGFEASYQLFLKRHCLINDDFPGLLVTSVSVRPARNRTGCPFAAL